LLVHGWEQREQEVLPAATHTACSTRPACTPRPPVNTGAWRLLNTTYLACCCADSGHGRRLCTRGSAGSHPVPAAPAPESAQGTSQLWHGGLRWAAHQGPPRMHPAAGRCDVRWRSMGARAAWQRQLPCPAQQLPRSSHMAAGTQPLHGFEPATLHRTGSGGCCQNDKLRCSLAPCPPLPAAAPTPLPAIRGRAGQRHLLFLLQPRVRLPLPVLELHHQVQVMCGGAGWGS
jgi:hypothetical protein